ncbi:MAG: DUF1194 domain-containing protein [Alphaproteobacteria bacterium]|nr:DUF1194 domain-containing protein [Alphaproteobacteria bacterium]MDX5367821.1 DUF1194 domain-containing protein [Alphaproteobacteria bacterium]MDX5462704.1 DUF1194 domain-containing protein [Alphaproteobacteria bacterium]
MRAWRTIRASLLAAGLWVAPAAAEEPVALELVLALDTSESVNAEEFALQARGLAAAFAHPRVQQAIARAGDGGVAIAVTQWAGLGEQTVSIPWTHLRGEADADALAARLAGLERAYLAGGTGIAAALTHAAALFEGNGFAGERLVIDISGDGRENRGGDVAGVRDAIVARGIGINGLPILNEDRFLYYYYRGNVIGGPGAFAEIANDYNDFANAIVEKLVREIGAPALSGLPAPEGGLAALFPAR